jgi:sulfonate dioxygenase
VHDSLQKEGPYVSIVFLALALSSAFSHRVNETVFRDQEINIHEQLELGRHFGPLHKHATTGLPIEPGLEEVHRKWLGIHTHFCLSLISRLGLVVYNDGSRRPNATLFAKGELWHSDVTYELQPPSTTSLKGITIPETGGDTLFSSGYVNVDCLSNNNQSHDAIRYGLYSSLSPGLQKYLESLSAVHSAVAQANGSRAAGLHVRRKEIETVHPLVRVHPATGWKSVFVNPGASI